jgi:tetratricopeptide (TPR) repeat protein
MMKLLMIGRRKPISAFEWNVLEALLLVLAATFLYGKTLAFGFVWDDRQLIVENPYFQQDFHWYEVFLGNFWKFSGVSESIPFYRPLVNLAYLLESRTYRIYPGPFHFTNLLMFISSLVMLWRLTFHFGFSRLSRVITCLFYVAHPALVPCVSFISCQGDLMAQFFGLAAILMWVREKPLRWFAWFFALLAMLCKESAVVIPLVMVSYDLILRKKDFKDWKTWFICTPWIPYFILRFIGLQDVQQAQLSFNEHGAFRIFAFVSRIVLPFPTSQVPALPTIPGFGAWLLILLLCLAGYFVHYKTKGQDRLRFLIVWIFLSLMIVADWLDQNIRFSDQLLYASMIPVSLLIGSIQIRTKTYLYGIFALILIFGSLSLSLIPNWKNDFKFWTNEMNYRSDDPTVLISYASAYNLQYKTKDACRLQYRIQELMKTNYNRTADLLSTYALGNCYLDVSASMAEIQYRKVLQLASRHWLAKNNLVVVLIKQQKFQEALKLSQELVVQKPDLFIVWKNLGVAYAKLGYYDEAIKTFQKASEIKPDDDQIGDMIAECRFKEKLIQNNAQKNRK